MEHEEIVKKLVKHFGDEHSEEIESSLKTDSGRYSDWGDSGSFTADGDEYTYISSDEEATRIALKIVEEQLQHEPEMFSQDWLKQHYYVTDTDKRIVANEEADSRMESLDDEEILISSDMEEEWEAAESDDAKDAILEKAKDKLLEDHYEDVYRMLEKDPIGYFADEIGMGLEETLKMNVLSLDTREAAEDAVRTDGWAHFLSLYDGDYTELDGGLVIFKE
jgi:hypothetical protein